MVYENRNNEDWIESTGNVFSDLDLPEPDDLLLKAKLVHKISTIIDSRALTQAQAAKILGIDQPKVSALLNGKLSGFSIERLIKFLNALNTKVDVAFIDIEPVNEPTKLIQARSKRSPLGVNNTRAAQVTSNTRSATTGKALSNKVTSRSTNQKYKATACDVPKPTKNKPKK